LSVFMGTELQATAERVYLNTAVAEVVGDLRYARSLAVREGQTVQVALDPDRPGVTLYRSSDATQPVAPMRNLMNRGIRTIRSTGGRVLLFHPRGTSSTPTTLTLEDRRGVHRDGVVEGRLQDSGNEEDAVAGAGEYSAHQTLDGIIVTWTVRPDRPSLASSRTTTITVTAAWSDQGGRRHMVRLGMRRANPVFNGGSL